MESGARICRPQSTNTMQFVWRQDRFCGDQASYPVGALKMATQRPGRKDAHSPSYSAEIKNTWSYTPLYHTSSKCDSELPLSYRSRCYAHGCCLQEYLRLSFVLFLGILTQLSIIIALEASQISDLFLTERSPRGVQTYLPERCTRPPRWLCRSACQNYSRHRHIHGVSDWPCSCDSWRKPEPGVCNK
jgi:hypothetical protein